MVLVGEVGMGRAGIVLGLEVLRLARNSTDWHRLLEICALTDTLILDEDGIYNPSDFNDRLLIGLKGTMSDAELHVLRARLRGGILNQARRGALKSPLPVGLVYDPAGNVALLGETLYAHEREAIDFAIQKVPNSDPIHLWALLELLEPSTGRLNEIDLLVLGYSALYLVEIKSGPGRYEGDFVDWLWTPPGGNLRRMDAPLRIANHKAKVLRSRLMAKMAEPHRVPRPRTLLRAFDVRHVFSSRCPQPCPPPGSCSG